jgi:hypothetical protein
MSENQNLVADPPADVLLHGLDGTNPLGFLAALGAFRVFAVSNPNVMMCWKSSDGAWRPAFRGLGFSVEQVGGKLFEDLKKLDNSVWSLSKKLPFAGVRLRSEASLAVAAASVGDRQRADLIASLGVECFRDEEGDFEDTALRMVRSGDSTGQGLLAYGKRILEKTTAQELQDCVTSIWRHQDEQCALRWDPTEDKSYALQWRDPSKVGANSVRGANCLALIAMSMYPAIPVKGEAWTVGFGLREPKQLSFTWPIWNAPLIADIVKSLLSLPLLQRPQPDRMQLRHRGIVAAYRCNRVMTSKYYANFTPSLRVA